MGLTLMRLFQNSFFIWEPHQTTMPLPLVQIHCLSPDYRLGANEFGSRYTQGCTATGGFTLGYTMRHLRDEGC